MGRWITRNGAHIYISDEDEIIEQEKVKDRQIQANKNEADKLNNLFETHNNTNENTVVIPKTLYHGTDVANISEFNIQGKESNGAIFFADDVDYAEEEAYVKNERTGKGKYLYEVSLNIKNPLQVKMKPDKFGDPTQERIYIKQAKAEGYDSVIFENDTDDELFKQKFYAVFDPTHIKIKNKRSL